MADVIVAVQALSLEEISTPVTITGVARLTAETYAVQVTCELWDASDPVPPIPSGTWKAAFWNPDAPTLTAVFRVGPSSPVGALTAGARYRVYLQITGAGLVVVEDIGTLMVGIPSTYSGSPSTSPRDAVRFELGDTTSPFAFSDAEVDYSIANNVGSGVPVLAAAADLAAALAMRYGKEFEQETNGDLMVLKGRRWDSMLKLSQQLAERARTGDPGTYVIDGFFADPELADATARGKPQFALGQMDNHQGHW